MEIAHVALALVVVLWLAMSLCKIDVWCGGCGGGSAGGPNGDGCKRLSLQWERVVCHLQCGGGGSGAVVVVVVAVGVFHKTTGAIIAMDMATGAMANGRLCRPRFCIGRGTVVFNVLVTCSVVLVLATAEVVQVAVGRNQCCCCRYGCMPDEMKTSGMRCKHPRQRMPFRATSSMKREPRAARGGVAWAGGLWAEVGAAFKPARSGCRAAGARLPQARNGLEGPGARVARRTSLNTPRSNPPRLPLSLAESATPA